MSKRLSFLGIALAVGGIAAGLGYLIGSDLQDAGADSVGAWGLDLDHSAPAWLEIPAPDVEFRTAEGGTARLADYQGQIVLLNFWGIWCTRCRDEIPRLTELDRKQRGAGLVVLGQHLADQHREAGDADPSRPCRRVCGGRLCLEVASVPARRAATSIP